MIEVVMEVDDEFWDNITQLTVFKEQKEIIHCEDCKYWVENKTTKGSYRNCIFSKTMMHADDFCSRGVKK